MRFLQRIEVGRARGAGSKRRKIRMGALGRDAAEISARSEVGHDRPTCEKRDKREKGSWSDQRLGHREYLIQGHMGLDRSESRDSYGVPQKINDGAET